MTFSRRSFMALLAAAPAVLAASPAHAFKTLETSDIPASTVEKPAGGAWEILAHATDGTDPSTAITTELPRISPAIRDLAGQRITLQGYLQPVGAGFGKTEYVLSRQPYHCSFCFPAGRAGLALVVAKQPLPDTTKRVTLSGVLHLQETAPDDFYFQLHDVSVIS